MVEGSDERLHRRLTQLHGEILRFSYTSSVRAMCEENVVFSTEHF